MHTCGVLEKSTSTGKVRPGILNTGTLPKKLLNLSASSVAEGQEGRQATRMRAGEHQIEETGARLRAMMPWITKNKLVDKDRN